MDYTLLAQDVLLWAPALGGLATCAGPVFAGWQIGLAARTQARDLRWRRTEFTRQLLERITSDDEYEFCLRALDWSFGPLPIPERHRSLFDTPRAVISHDPNRMARALAPEIDTEVAQKLRAFQPGSDWELDLIYRLSFDNFFAKLVSIHRYATGGLIDSQDLVGLDYVLSLVRDAPHVDWDRTQGREANPFFPFVKAFYEDLVPVVWPSTAITPPR